MNADLRNWLNVAGLPRLATVPGDVLAGFLLAGGVSLDGAGWTRLGYAVGAMLTAAVSDGIMLSAVRGSGTDAKESAEPPIAAGAIPARCLWLVFGVAILSALNLAVGAGAGSKCSLPMAVVVVLLALIWPLRRKAERGGWTAAFAAALWRVGGVLLGAAVCSPLEFSPAGGPFTVPVGAGAAALGIYAGAVERLARRAERQSNLLPFLAIVFVLAPAMLAWVFAGGRTEEPPALFVALAGFAFAMPMLHSLMLWRVYPRYVDVPQLLDRHRLNVVRVQLALTVVTAVSGEAFVPVLAVALGLCALRVLCGFLSVRFPSL